MYSVDQRNVQSNAMHLRAWRVHRRSTKFVILIPFNRSVPTSLALNIWLDGSSFHCLFNWLIYFHLTLNNYSLTHIQTISTLITFWLFRSTLMPSVCEKYNSIHTGYCLANSTCATSIDLVSIHIDKKNKTTKKPWNTIVFFQFWFLPKTETKFLRSVRTKRESNISNVAVQSVARRVHAMQPR